MNAKNAKLSVSQVEKIVHIGIGGNVDLCG